MIAVDFAFFFFFGFGFVRFSLNVLVFCSILFMLVFVDRFPSQVYRCLLVICFSSIRIEIVFVFVCWDFECANQTAKKAIKYTNFTRTSNVSAFFFRSRIYSALGSRWMELTFAVNRGVDDTKRKLTDWCTNQNTNFTCVQSFRVGRESFDFFFFLFDRFHTHRKWIGLNERNEFFQF